MKTESSVLQTRLKILESKICYRDDPEYIHCEEEVNKLYLGKINSAIIRSRCDWYEHQEESSKFFLNLEKSHAVQNQIRTVSCNEKK